MSDIGATNDEQAEFWEKRADSWLEAERDGPVIAGRFGPLAMARLDVAAGERVLDVGCGSGATTIELARRAGPGGEAVGADISPSLVAVATERAGAEGIANATFRVADAQVDDLGESSYDAAFSQFGVMFFADPPVAFANIRRALRPGGRLAFVCWQTVFANEWMLVPGLAVAEVTGELPPMPGPGAPGPFSLAEPGRIDDVLDQAGFTEIAVTAHEDVIVVPERDMERMVTAARNMGPVGIALQAVDDDDTRARLVAAVRAALYERLADGELRLGAGVLVASAVA